MKLDEDDDVVVEATWYGQINMTSLFSTVPFA